MKLPNDYVDEESENIDRRHAWEEARYAVGFVLLIIAAILIVGGVIWQSLLEYGRDMSEFGQDMGGTLPMANLEVDDDEMYDGGQGQ